MKIAGEISLRRSSVEDWDRVCRKFADYNFEQSYEYASSLSSSQDRSVELYVLESGSHIVAAACVRVRKIPFTGTRIAYVSNGPLIHDPGRLEPVLMALESELVGERGYIVFLRLPANPRWQAVDVDVICAKLGVQDTQLVRSYRTVLVDLKPEPEEIRSSLAAKWRSDLKSAERAGIKLECGSSPALCQRFMRLFDEMEDRKDLSVALRPDFFFTLPAERLGLTVSIASRHGQDIGGHVTSHLGDTAVYLFGASNESGRRSKVGFLLNWQAMMMARSEGARWYDLGGIDEAANPGGYRFKKRTGGVEITAAGPFVKHPSRLTSVFALCGLKLRDRFSRH